MDASAAFSPRFEKVFSALKKDDRSEFEDNGMNSTHQTLPEYVRTRGGTQPISRILIANNGIAAVKAIRSIRKWAYETFNNDRVIEFVVMATPEDLKANAAYIHLADEFVQVPGGTNNNNYANIQLITDIAERTGAHAVWAGWGHASENAKLPEMLSATKNKVVWIGPPPSAMRALGDKIGSTIIAQTARVPCMPWSGDELTVDYQREGIPVDLYNKACVVSAAQALEVCERIGYPVMIKASEGGGGKGIRRVTEADQVDLAFSQVKGEVPGSPIFIMKLAPTCRHLEVQLLADAHGEAIAIFGRDCSIQRRHQKIIEEGPVVAAPPPVWREMEKAAVRLAKEVGYIGAGTVEYLYLESGEYYFLELNPRLQVEHPVTELISGVNLPAAQLQVAMGIPLHLIRGIRRMYGERPDTVTPIDFDQREASTLPGHVIACRITAENPDSEFQPTSGVIQELNFRSTPDVWGYFSVAAKGIVHEYSDSQFGHMFALGETREIARRNMVLALKELSIRGDIRTTIEYLRKILETEDFRKNKISTTWLEVVLKERIVTTEKPDTHLAVLLGALFRVVKLQITREKEFNEILTRGQMPSAALHHDLVEVKADLIYQKTKYIVSVAKTGANSYDLSINNWRGSAEAHILSDDGLLVLMNAKKHVLYGQEFPSGLRLTVDGKTCLFETEYDPSSLRAAMAGKLVRYLIADGAHVNKDKPYAEVEVMKMYISLTAPESGYIRTIKPEGAVLEAGDLIATLTLDDPARVQKAELYTGTFPILRPPQIASDSPHQHLKNSRHSLQMILSGYAVSTESVAKSVTEMMSAMRDPRLPLEQFREILSNLSGRIPQQLYDDFNDILNTYHQHISNHRFYWESPESFSVLDLQNAIDRQMLSLDDAAKISLNTQLAASGVIGILDSFKNGNHTYAVHILSSLFDDFFNVEYTFCSEETPEYVIKALRKQHKDDIVPVMRFARAHYLIKRRSDLIINLLDVIESQLNPLISAFLPVLRRLALLSSKETANVALKARSLIMRQQLPSNNQRRIAIETILNNASACAGELRKERLAPLIDQCQPIEDLIFPFMESKRPVIQGVAMEAYIRRLYQVYNIASVDVNVHKEHGGLVLGRWEFFMSESSVRNEDDADSGKVSPTQSPTSHSRTTNNQYHGRSSSGPSSAPHPIPSPTSSMSRRQHDEYLLRKIDSVANISLVNAAEESERENDVQLVRKPVAMQPYRTGVMAIFKDFDNLKQGWEDILIEFDNVTSFAEPVHVLYLGFHWRGRMPSDDNLAQYFQTFIQPHTEVLQSRGIRTVTFVTNQESKEDYPLYFTYRYQLKYEEDPLIRHIEPSYALHMQLQKLHNFDLRYIPTSNRLVHLFAGYPASQPGSGVPLHGTVANPMQERKVEPGTPYDGRRVFARSIVRKLDSALLFKFTDTDDMDLDAHPEAEVAFLEALNSVEIAIGSDTRVWKFNSIFLNILAEVSIDPSYIEAVVRLLARRYSDKIRRLNISTVEFAINIKPTADTANAIAYRFICTNPTGHALVVDMYQERRDSTNGKIAFKYIRKQTDKDDVKAYWDTLDIYTPYPVQTPFQRQRDMASNMDTVYVYDAMPLLEHAISKCWRRRTRSSAMRDRRSRAHSMEMPWTLRMLRGEEFADERPTNLLAWSELILQADNGSWKLVESKRAPGLNDIGMVAWKCTLITPECPNGRDIVFISNDITHQAGTFGPLEDVLFDLASKYARERRIPRIYLAANSGARIGLAEELRHKFKVAWTSDDPSKGFQYLYLIPEDYEVLKDSVVAETAIVEGETRYIIRDIVGKKDGLGVENLRGSGMIAGETSLAYEEIFTLTYVTGRTVGIGAYLARLGQRVIQKASPAQPLILTGYNALNKLLGRAVYTSNLQLGGPEIMYTNGVSHLTAADDMDGFIQILQWLSYVPTVREAIPPILVSVQPDPVDRKISLKLTKAPYDPRLMMTGQITETGQWLSGFFDRDSWFELLGGWAKTVVVGRARLGGYPIGVVAVETRTVEQIVPADPADPVSKETVLQRAGQVWYPDSAWKTAQAIKDCQAEDIPLIVFANWRGFSGGMKDMFEEILKFGSYIVDSLRTYRQPIFIYIPPYGTLRGGAWVVVDQTINEQYMEMYADETGRAGVLETEGTLDVKFRKKDILIQAHRLDAKLHALDAELKAATSETGRSREIIMKEIRAREEALYPTFYNIATQFADMHDTPGRMKAKGCLQGVVNWEHARSYFYYRLQRRLIELHASQRIEKCMADINERSWKVALNIFRQWVQTEATATNSEAAIKADRSFCEWFVPRTAKFEQFFSEWSATQHVECALRILKQHPSNRTISNDDVTVDNLIGVIKKLTPEQQKRLEEAFSR